MKQFLTGFAVASVVWFGVLYAQATGGISLFGDGDDATVAPQVDTDVGPTTAPDEAAPKKKRRGGRRRRRGDGAPMKAAAWDTSVGQAGDDLEVSPREVSMGQGAEDQLSEAEIDKGIDRVFRGIQRCLLALPPDAPATGKVIFGMHIASSGQVTRVNLKGPNVMIQGEVGACFRRTARTIRFRAFDGPDMIAHYPIVFE